MPRRRRNDLICDDRLSISDSVESEIDNRKSTNPMSTLAVLPRTDVRPGMPFALAALAVACLSAVLAGWLPLGFSIVTVFLFAGPHNWLELRYFMGRPAWRPAYHLVLCAVPLLIGLLWWQLASSA